MSIKMLKTAAFPSVECITPCLLLKKFLKHSPSDKQSNSEYSNTASFAKRKHGLNRLNCNAHLCYDFPKQDLAVAK